MSYNYNHQPRAPIRGYAGHGGHGGHASSSSPSSSATAASAISSLADWAARSLDPEIKVTAVQRYVDRCCDPIHTQPNLALNLELADYIKHKQANTPRDAATAVVQKINSRHPHVSLLALDLLDHLVKNVGYPFHLQIATKEFLNELVKRFPERPPLFASPTQTRILALVHEWKNTICIDSKRKEDLVHIRDMHRLLTYKGYRFPNLDARVKGVLNPENNLQTPEELEEEDRAAQAAKLQELIRRGTPRDLEQAQELMKIMSGAEPERKPDYASQTNKELDKVQSRAILLNDMLNNYQQGENFVKGDGYDQIASHLRSVQPRLQKWISQEEGGGGGGGGDDDAAESSSSSLTDRLLLLNDLVNQICDRYEAFKRGHFDAQAVIDASIDPAKGGSSAVPTAKLTDLISFDDEQAGAQGATMDAQGGGGSVGTSLMDDFASLTFDPTPAAVPPNTTSGLPPDLFDASKLSRAPAAPLQPQDSGSRLGGWGALQLPLSASASASASASGSRGNGSAAPQSQLQTSQQQQQQQSSSKAKDKEKGKDPFEDLLA